VSVSLPASPYKGLNAFGDSELDALLFFGREREREIVAANLTASRLTVLYGPSGVGKSSLLSAAVARSMRRLPEQPLVVVFSRWSDDPAASLAEAVAEAEGSARDGSALEVLERAQAARDVYVILDQAEEYFLYHADDTGPGSFAETLPTLLSGPNRVNVLISLREDSLAKLDRFTGHIPGLFGNTLRLDRLDREAARAAIVHPVERFVELTGQQASVEPALVERVLDDVGTGRIEPALGGLGAVEAATEGARIEAPYLQLVMQRLWEEERAAGSEVLRVGTLDRLGGARQIVEDHLEGAMAELTAHEQDVAARLFNHLVTPSGTKIAHEVSDLADFGHVTAEELQPVLTTLAGRRILRSLEEAGGVRYEIFHDVLAQPVLAWRARHRTEREVEQRLVEAHRRRRKLQLLFGLVLAALGLMTAIAIFAVSQRSVARHERAKAQEQAQLAIAQRAAADRASATAKAKARIARANARKLRGALVKLQQQTRTTQQRTREARALRIEALARDKRTTNPELSLLLAQQAVKIAHTGTSEETLAEALQASRIRRVVPLGEPLLRAVVRRGVVIAATKGGSVVTADLSSGHVRLRARTGVPATAATFSGDGSALLTGTDEQLRLVGPSGAVTPVPLGLRVGGGALSADGRKALAYNWYGAYLVDVVSGRTDVTVPHAKTYRAALSRDGTLAATVAADKTLWVSRVATGERVIKISTKAGDLTALAISPHDRFVAGGNTKLIGHVWRVKNGHTLVTLSGHNDRIADIDFSPDGRYVVTASRDGTMHIFDLARGGTTVAVLHSPAHPMTSASFVTAAMVVSADGNQARLWNARPLKDLKVHGTLRELIAMADRRLAATGRKLTPAERKQYHLR
jgi:Novel STAND NTPase 1/WD domain, G-beta repeat